MKKPEPLTPKPATQARVQQTVLNDGYEEIKKMIDLRRKKHGRAKVFIESLKPLSLNINP